VDELGFSARSSARPRQAAAFSAGSFTAGGAFPLLVAALASPPYVIPLTVGASLVCLFALGAASAKAAGARMFTAAFRVTGWSALAMGVTAGVGALVGSLS
jgi:VIT1/CCC1 family predicted Fe2+/Mn2+ transporter